MKVDGMDEKLVNAMFETVPVEITVIDALDKVIAWNKHSNRLFNRPEACYGMDFRECHPQESLSLVEAIVQEMKSGKRKKARFWIDMRPDRTQSARRKVLIEFYALHDNDGHYIGCMECTLDVQDIMELKGEKRLLDEERL
ncbi:MAG TPA: PAS domain-containing protein [Chitinivibrionales bacterium]|nr:PAS domain-containing protein [Chitinivibrionales bacterium]